MKNQKKVQSELPVYLTINEVGAIIRDPSYGAVIRFAKDNKLRVVKRPRRILFIQSEVYAALEKDTQILGI